MGRIIINNKSDLPDTTALEIVLKVIQAGRISNEGKQYCYLSTSYVNGIQYDCASDLRKGSDSFVIYYSPYNNPNFLKDIH